MFLRQPSIVEAAAAVVAPAAAVVIDRDMTIVAAQGSAFERHGQTADDWIGRRLEDVLPASARDELLARYREALAGERQSFDYWSSDGHHGYWVQIVRDPDQDDTVVAVMQDITERLVAMGELERSESRLHEAERLAGVGSWELQPDSERFTYTKGFARILGIAPDQELTLAELLEMVLPEDRKVLARAVQECEAAGKSSCEYRVRDTNGEIRTILGQGEALANLDGRRPLLHGAILDVTEARVAEAERTAALSVFRQGFDTAPIGMVLTEPGTGRYLRVNDTMCEMLGRSRGELLALSYKDVTVAEDVPAEEEGRKVMAEGASAGNETEKRYEHSDGSIIWATLHVTPVRRDDGSVEAFFSQVVDISERKAREARLDVHVADATWLARIRAALDEDRLVLYRQPIVDLADGRTVQNELLLRMVGEDGTIHAPGEFLPIAERYGLITEIDRWVIRQAVRLAAEGEPVELNISGRSLGDPTVLRELEHAIECTDVDPSLVVVEVTETAVADNLNAARAFAERVADLGCGLALDDFGTGFANLSSLKHIPFDHLKIDREFIGDLVGNVTDRRLVQGIVSFAHAFGQVTVAEGVEDEETLVVLSEMGVDRAQGFLLGRPAPYADVGPTTTDGCGREPRDQTGLVRTAFERFAQRDPDGLAELCAEDVMVRPEGTATHAKRTQGYRGPEGVREYFDDVDAVWRTLSLRPHTFRPADRGSVLVFGEVEGDTGSSRVAVDAIWVWRVRDDRIASVEVFAVPTREAPLSPSTVTAGPSRPARDRAASRRGRGRTDHAAT